MAKTKSKGSTQLGRDSISKRLGIKLFDGQVAKTGNIIVRQRGTKFLPGKNVRRAKNDTLYAVKEGKIKFRTIRKIGFNSRRKTIKVVDILSQPKNPSKK